MNVRSLKAVCAVSIALNVLGAALATFVVMRKGGIGYLTRYTEILRGEASSIETFPVYYQQRLSTFWGEPVAAPGSVVLVGDSLTEEHDFTGVCGAAPVVNRGISADTTVGVLFRVPEIARHRPAAALVMIGIADLRIGRSPARVAETYEAVLVALRSRSPQTKLVVQSVLPIDPKRFGSEIDPASVVELDRRLAEVARRQGATYLDLFPAFARGNVLADELSKDGVHLTEPGYRLWHERIAQLGCP